MLATGLAFVTALLPSPEHWGLAIPAKEESIPSYKMQLAVNLPFPIQLSIMNTVSDEKGGWP
jgi:hypothetical protein